MTKEFKFFNSRRWSETYNVEVLDLKDVEKCIDLLKEDFKRRIDTNTNVRDIDEGTLFEWEVDEIIENRL